ETLLFRARRALAQNLETDPQPRKRGRPRATEGGGQLVAVLKSLFVGGATKIAATALTVAATSVVAAAPPVRHQLVQVFSGTSRPKPKTDPALLGKAQARTRVPAVHAAAVVAASPALVAVPHRAAAAMTHAPARAAPTTERAPKRSPTAALVMTTAHRTVS